MSRETRLGTVAAASVLLLALGAVPPPAGAAPGTDPAPSSPSHTQRAQARIQQAQPRAQGRASVADVTLLTGHRVRVTRRSDGKQSAIVEAPPGRRDGSAFAFTDKSGDLHVLPRQAMPYLQAGRLDGRLFNVTDLIAQGYADRDRTGIPLIISYPRTTPVADQAPALRSAGGSATRAFGSAEVVTLTVPKPATGDFWDAVSDPQPAARSAPRLLGGATKIWLDGKIRADLEQSVPLIGAPQAWASGYDGAGVKVAVLDTGYDSAHPDLAGKVAEARGFTGDGSAVDGNGHGTHVAATVAGTGAASAGSRKGVAPGAQLLVGKVLGDDGQGHESWVLAGMEWAADSGAKVVSMSLGGSPSDGTDPLSVAVDSLTATTGALFVIAAGNSGPSPGTVGSPAAATEALAVGNTDKADRLNESSSRGPRLGDHAVKPELTAPGTDIVAARAAGTSLGDPVDEHYTSLTGTSMATPHVAGAAAILAQRHPDWTPTRIKAALTGSAHAPQSGTVFEHGAGRLDVPAALDAAVVADHSTLAFGVLPWPGTGAEPIVRTVGYRNTGTGPVTLDLGASAEYTTGTALPPGAVTVTPAQLVVPPGGSGSAQVTVDPALIGVGDVGGLLIATGNGVAIRTPFSYGEEEEQYDLTVDAVGKDGKSSHGWAQVWSEQMGAFFYGIRFDGTGPQTVRLPKADYLVIGVSTEYGAEGEIVDETVAGTPQLTLSQDRTVVLDARQGKELDFRTPRPSTPSQLQLGWSRWFDSGQEMGSQLLYQGKLPRLAIAPSAPISTGRFEFVAGGRLLAKTATVGRTPYLYDLLLPTAGRLPASATYRVREDRDLARIDTTFAGVGTGGRTTKETRTGFSPLSWLRVGGLSDVHHPGPRADYVSANGTTWESMVRLPQAGDAEVPTMWDNFRSYPAGRRFSTRWWGAPYAAGTDSDYSVTDAYREENRLSVLLRDYQDGEADHWGDTYPSEQPPDQVRSRFYRGTTKLADVPGSGFDVADLPPEPTTYRLVHSVTRTGPVWTSSAYSESDWTFRSEHQTVTTWPPQGIPLLDVNWRVPVDVQNRAPARSLFTIGLHARHVRGLTAGRLLPAKMSVSYDDGRHWRPVPLLRHGDDRYVGVLLHPPKSLTSGWVSIRAEVKDTAGGSLKQTTIRAYALR